MTFNIIWVKKKLKKKVKLSLFTQIKKHMGIIQRNGEFICNVIGCNGSNSLNIFYKSSPPKLNNWTNNRRDPT